MRTLLEPVEVPAGALAAIRPSYVACTQHAGLIALFGVDPLAAFVERARRDGWRLTHLDAPHDAMVTAPAATAEVLLGHA
jgi:hypothetical protein